MAVETVDPKDPKLFREQQKEVEKSVQVLAVMKKKEAAQLYRSWVHPVKKVRTPSSDVQPMLIINPDVQQPRLEQSFSKMKEWEAGKAIQVYEKSKDFDKVLNPLSLRDFNRFTYRRNSSSP